MEMMKKRSGLRVLILFLALFLTASCFASCVANAPTGDPSQNTEANTTPSGEVTGGEGEADPPMLEAEDFGDSNGNPRSFHIMARAGRTHYIYAETISGDRVSSAAYRRNNKINDMFNIHIRLLEGIDEDGAAWQNALLTASGEYDLIVPDYWWKIEQSGLVADLAAMTELELSDPWWFQGWNDNATLAGKLYSITGDATLELLENIEVVYFNTTMATANNMDLYRVVDDKEWTLSKMLEFGQAASSNVDGTIEGAPVVYGALYDRMSTDTQISAAGIKVIEINADGIPVNNATNQININICDAIQAMYADDSFYFNDKVARTPANHNVDKFISGEALFFSSCLYLGKTLKASDVSYGILPQPKYEKEQDYISSTYGVSFFCIPNSAKDIHCSAVILNALNCLSNPQSELGQSSLTYQWFDMVVMGNLAANQNDARMLDLVRNSLYVDFSFMYNVNLNLFSTFTKAVKTNSSVGNLLPAVLDSVPDALAELLSHYQ